MYEMDFALLNNLQWLMYHKTKPNQLFYCGHSMSSILTNDLSALKMHFLEK